MSFAFVFTVAMREQSHKPLKTILLFPATTDHQSTVVITEVEMTYLATSEILLTSRKMERNMVVTRRAIITDNQPLIG